MTLKGPLRDSLDCPLGDQGRGQGGNPWKGLGERPLIVQGPIDNSQGGRGHGPRHTYIHTYGHGLFLFPCVCTESRFKAASKAQPLSGPIRAAVCAAALRCLRRLPITFSRWRPIASRDGDSPCRSPCLSRLPITPCSSSCAWQTDSVGASSLASPRCE